MLEFLNRLFNIQEYKFDSDVINKYKNKTDEELLREDWEVVGEELSKVMGLKKGVK